MKGIELLLYIRRELRCLGRKIVKAEEIRHESEAVSLGISLL